jgi:cytochrome c556
MNRKFGLLAAVVTLGTLPALAADPAMRAAAKARHENFEIMGEAFEAIEKEAKKPAPNAGLVQEKAAEIDRLAGEQGNWFPAGSGPKDGIRTKAKPEVWTKPTEFLEIQNRFISEAGKLKVVAGEGDAKALAKQVEATGQACSDCHNEFRSLGGILSLFGL